MNEDAIQNQIKLIGFRAANFNFKTEANPERKESLNKKFNLDLDNLLFKDSPNHFIKAFKVDLNFDSLEHDEIYDLTVEYHVIFECSVNVNKEFLESDFAKISAPAIGFPYLRAFISTFSIQAGIPPIILPSINFIQFSKEFEKHKKPSI
jgi:preprotein translocase subunit SecB